MWKSRLLGVLALILSVLLPLSGAASVEVNTSQRILTTTRVDSHGALPARLSTKCAAHNPLSGTFVKRWQRSYSTATFQIVVTDVSHGCTYSLNKGRQTEYATASTVKLLIAVGTLRNVQSGRTTLAAVSGDLRRMIRISDNDAANRLWNLMGGRTGFDRLSHTLQLRNTHHGRTWGSALTTAEDQAQVLTSVFVKSPGFLSPAMTKYLRQLLISVVPSQSWGAGVGDLPQGWSRGVKNGWYFALPGDYGPENRWRINTLGIVWDNKAKPRWIMCGYSDTWLDDDTGEMAWSTMSLHVTRTLLAALN